MREDLRFLPAGDQALVVELGDTIDPQTNRQVHGLMNAIERAEVPGVFDLVPTYRSVLVYFDAVQTPLSALQARISELYLGLEGQAVGEPRTVEIPTLYGGEGGPDLEFVAEHAGLTPQEVIDNHSGTDYLVYMMGFSPGFPYLGGLSKRLATPRLETPRLAIPAGSVGIAEGQTGVYPVASPGGWRLIGRSPLRMFDPEAEPPSRLAAGDYVRFVPIASEAEYLKLQESAGGGVHAGYAAQ